MEIFQDAVLELGGREKGKQKEGGTNSFDLIVTKMSVCIFCRLLFCWPDAGYLQVRLLLIQFFVGLGLILKFSMSLYFSLSLFFVRGRLLSEMLNCSEKWDDYK